MNPADGDPPPDLELQDPRQDPDEAAALHLYLLL